MTYLAVNKITWTHNAIAWTTWKAKAILIVSEHIPTTHQGNIAKRTSFENENYGKAN